MILPMRPADVNILLFKLNSLNWDKIILFKIDSIIEGVMTWEKWPHLFVDSEAYQEQMGLTPSSKGILDVALSNAHT